MIRFLLIFYSIINVNYSISQGIKQNWPDEIANDVVPCHSLGLVLGPMLGHPASTKMRIWIKTDAPKDFYLVYSEHLPFGNDAKEVSGNTNAKDHMTGFVELDNLKPDTRYYYGIKLEGKLADIRKDFLSDWPSFRTLPDHKSYIDPDYNPNGVFNFEFGIGFGNRQGNDRYNDPAIYYNLMKHHSDLSFFIMNGDYIYEDTRTRENLPHSLDMFRQDYEIYMKRAPGMTWMMRNIPFVFQYDDHESFSDLEGTGEIGLKDGKWLYRDLSLKAYYEYAGWANYSGPQSQPIVFGQAKIQKGSNFIYDQLADFTLLRPKAISNVHVGLGQKNAGVYAFNQIIDKHTISVSPGFSQNEQARYSVGTNHYYDWKVSNCHFFAIDVRGERTRYIPEKVANPDRWLLGERQKNWLKNGIERSDADFIFVISTVSWMIYHTNFHMYASGLVKGKPKLINNRSVKEDGFTGALYERNELLNFFDELEKPVVIFTGDLHNGYILQISDNVWECMIGPLNSGNHNLASAGNPPLGGWFDSEGWPVKIKWVSSFPNKLSFLQLRNNYYGVVSVNNIIKSARSDQPGYHFIAYDEPQVILQVYDAYNGKLVYAEGISTIDSKKRKTVIKPGVN